MQLGAISSLAEEATFSSLKKQTLEHEDFLNLLVTQLKNQDPLNPLDNAEFTSQIAQFNQLDEMYNVNDNLAQLDESLNKMNSFFLTSLIGKKAVVQGSAIHLDSPEGASIGYKLNNDDVDVQINIFNEAHQLVKSFVYPGMNEGFHELWWDGTDNAGEQLDLGNYTFEVTAANDTDSVISILPFMTGKISEITLGESPSIEIDGKEILLSDIIKIKEGDN
ncbi:MAG: flagellar hook assembly protein FlgD [bacterium]